jgi:hypothetical protein
MGKLFADYPLVTTLADADRLATGASGAVVNNMLFSDLATELGRQFSAQNKDSVTFAIGNPVAIHTSGVGVVQAEAADNLMNAVGLARLGVGVGASESVQVSGILTLADWTAITGSVSLAARANYYLSPTAGMLTSTAPSTVGQVVQLVGRALSTTDMEIVIGSAVLL